MKILNNEKGVALITVLLFSLVGFGVVIGAYYMTISGTRMSGIEQRYISELDAGKGVSDYVMGRLVKANLQCNDNTCEDDITPDSCAPESTIDISMEVCNALGKQPVGKGCADLTACYMNIETITEIDPITSDTNIIDLISINVQSSNPSRGEQANIDFVLRVE